MSVAFDMLAVVTEFTLIADRNTTQVVFKDYPPSGILISLKAENNTTTFTLGLVSKPVDIMQRTDNELHIYIHGQHDPYNFRLPKTAHAEIIEKAVAPLIPEAAATETREDVLVAEPVNPSPRTRYRQWLAPQ